jgi:hypothetical protein
LDRAEMTHRAAQVKRSHGAACRRRHRKLPDRSTVAARSIGRRWRRQEHEVLCRALNEGDRFLSALSFQVRRRSGSQAMTCIAVNKRRADCGRTAASHAPDVEFDRGVTSLMPCASPGIVKSQGLVDRHFVG